MVIDFELAKDIGLATLPGFHKQSLQMTHAITTCELYNTWIKKAEKRAGKRIEDFVTLKDTGNAQGTSISGWEKDTTNKVNTDEKSSVNWVGATTNMEYSVVDIAVNQGSAVEINNMLKSKHQNMYREFAEMLQSKFVLSPTSSSDKNSPHGLASWLALGTADSKGAFTGYSGRYNDGAGTTYDLGGIECSSTVNPRWASYYADHDGNLSDTLLSRLFRAITKTSFIVPLEPKAVDKNTTWGNFRYYTNMNVLENLEALRRKTDDGISPDLGKHAGAVLYKNVPFVYVEELDTARATLYGTDPIYGVNHDYFKLATLAGRGFVLGTPMPRDEQHKIVKVPLDLEYAIRCVNRQRAGFLISAHA